MSNNFLSYLLYPSLGFRRPRAPGAIDLLHVKCESDAYMSLGSDTPTWSSFRFEGDFEGDTCGLLVLGWSSCISTSGEGAESVIESGVRTRCSLCGDDPASLVTFGGVEDGVGSVESAVSSFSGLGEIGG